MSVTLQIEGMSDCMRWCDAAPKDMVKLAKKAMRSGARAVTKRMMPKIDERWRPLVKYALEGGKNDQDLACNVGLFNGRQRQGHQSASGTVDDWFKAYWKNYGTLTRRDPEHHFATSIRPAHQSRSRRRRNNVGQPHLNFFENALEGYEDVFFDAFSRTVNDNIEDCYER